MSPETFWKTRFTSSERTAGHALPPQRAPKQCPSKGVSIILRVCVSRHGLLGTVKKHMRKFHGKFREVCGIFFTHKRKAQKTSGKFGSVFLRRFVPRKKYFAPTSFCRRATLSFGVRIFRSFRVFALWNLVRPLFFCGARDLPHLPHHFPLSLSMAQLT